MDFIKRWQTKKLYVAMMLFSFGILFGNGTTAPYKVYIFSGQSNMGVSAGRDFVETNHPEMYSWLQSADNDALFFYRSTSSDINQNEDGEVVGQGGQMGYEAMFAYHAARYWKQRNPEQRIAIVKVAQGATGISYFLPAGRSAGKHWAINGDYPWKREGKVHVSLRECFEEAIDSLESKGHTWEGGGFVWYQGESDAVSVISSLFGEEYLANLTDLIIGADAVHHPDDPPEQGQAAKGDDPSLDRIMGIRDYLRNPVAPAIVARIMWYPDNPNRGGGCSMYNATLVRNALTTFGDDPQNQPAAWINVDDLSTSDGTHLDGASVVEAGNRFAKAYLRLLDTDNCVLPPKIDPTYRYFGDSIEISMSSRHSGAQIYYTLDGSEPTQSSTRYTAPLVLRSTTDVKARTYVSGRDPSEVRTVPFRRIDAWPATGPEGMVSGIKYYLYDIESEAFPDFDALTPTDSGITETLDFKSIAPADSMYGIRYTGYVTIPVSTFYTFVLKTHSSDSSELTIDDSLVLDKKGTDAFHRIIRNRRFPLASGRHAFQIDYYQFAGMNESWNGTKLDFAYKNVFEQQVALNDSSLWFFHSPNPTSLTRAKHVQKNGCCIIRGSQINIIGEGEHTIRLYRMNGTMVVFKKGNGRSHFDLSSKHLPAGTYLIAVNYNGRTAIKKYLVQK